MSLEPITDPEAVPIGLLRRYLAAHGWRSGTDGRSAHSGFTVHNQAVMRTMLKARSGGQRRFDLYVLSEEGAGDVEIVLPREPTATDLLYRVEGAIRTLSDVEGRDPEQVIADVRLIGYDVLRSRIPNMLVRDDSVHLQVATDFMARVHSLLAATATTEIDPQPYFLRVKKEGKEYADRCRFGHTFRGSFGFTIESPVVPNIEPTLPQIDQAAPFERKVITRLARGVRAIYEATQVSDVAPLATMATEGFSANACELFADMIEDTSPGGIDLSFSFSPEWAPPAELVEKRQFLVGTAHIEMARVAAKLLRTEFVSRPEKIVGRVTKLESDTDPSDLLNPKGEREITVQWDSDDLGKIDVKMSLTAEDYLHAVEAHKTGRQVMVSGTLERRKRSWLLSDPSDFQVP
jgi:hypothetical protein